MVNNNIFNKQKIEKIPPIDFFYETSYTSNTANGIKELYDTIIFACKSCKVRGVDTKMEILETRLPTFVLYRKNYCITCWLKFIYSK